MHNLLRKYFDLEYGDHPLQILSVFSRNTLQGYFYVEAEKQSYVKDALLNVQGAYSKIQLVPVGEMVDCLTIKKTDIELKPKQWVRIKKNRKYDGDLAQVTNFTTTLIQKTVIMLDCRSR